MRQPPDKPCENCKQAERCKLPLNCSHYLSWQRELRQYQADAKALRRIHLRGMDYQALPSTQERRKQLAQEHPWVKKEEAAMGSGIDYTQVRKLYEEGLNDKEISERTGIARVTIGKWRKRNGLPVNKRKTSEAQKQAVSAEPEPDAPERVRQLLALARPSDSPEARERISQLAAQWLQDWIRDELAGTAMGSHDG